MSQIINKLASIFKTTRHEFSESASRRSGRGVGDSARTTLSDHQTTNKQATSTFTGLIVTPAVALTVLGLGGVFGAQDTHATASSLSISISGSPTINIPPTASGKFSDSGNITITVNTTHAAGYGLSLTATGSSNPTSLATNSGAGTVGFTTLTAGTKIDADTFAATANTQYNNKWGYRYNKTGSTTSDDDKYRPSPSTSGDTLDTTSTNANNTYQFSIGARATTDTAMDSYANTFRFIVLANATPYTLTYIDNSGEATGMPANITDGESAAEGITLSSTEPSRDGYTFEGWCSVSTSDDSCSGTTYAAGGTYNLNLTSASNNVRLYAMWAQAGGGALYDVVAAAWAAEGSRVQTNDTNADTGIQAAITTSNSGVFKYNASVFGTSSDAANDHDIYYYRGILDTTVGSYGSDGDNAAHPNTVVLDANKNGKDTSDTCWRIVRTTGSGGVKMVYSGKWTGSTCANATTAAQVTTQAYAEKGTSSQSTYWYRNIHYVGYTFNNSVTDSTTNTSVDTVFGSNSNYSTTNTTNSAMKKYIENTWFSNISGYEGILESSAGYCNDRTAYSNQSTSPTALTTIAPYKTSSATMYFGANERNFVNDSAGPSLTCPRNVVDLYTTSSASNGNRQLGKPVALLTADESAFAGSGRSSGNPTTYHANSYLRSGSSFWLVSPNLRSSRGIASGFLLISGGYLSGGYVNDTYGVRPAISLASGTSASSGSGTAADPWVVTAP